MTIEILTRNALPSSLSTATVKAYLRVYDREHDDVIDMLIDAAVEFIQTYTRQTFRHTEFRYTTDIQPIVIPRFPVISVDDVEFTNSSDAFESLADLDDYELDADLVPPQFVGPSINAPVRVTWQAGIVSDADWPRDLVLLIWQIVDENFNRRGTTPATAQAAMFSRAHQLALEQYCTHHDSVK